jgi:hypothetical protein
MHRFDPRTGCEKSEKEAPADFLLDSFLAGEIPTVNENAHWLTFEDQPRPREESAVSILLAGGL